MLALLGAFVETQKRYGWDWTVIAVVIGLFVVVAVSAWITLRKG